MESFGSFGNCAFTVKVKNAQTAGATGVVVANNSDTGVFTMGGTDATINVPSLFVSLSDGNAIRAQLGAGVDLTARSTTRSLPTNGATTSPTGSSATRAVSPTTRGAAWARVGEISMRCT